MICNSRIVPSIVNGIASEFPSKYFLRKCFKIVFFFALASRSGFGATISDASVRSSFVFCNSVSADRIVMAASRLLRAVAALVLWYYCLLQLDLVNRIGVAA